MKRLIFAVFGRKAPKRRRKVPVHAKRVENSAKTGIIGVTVSLRNVE